VDDNAPPPERVEDKVERLEAEVRGSLMDRKQRYTTSYYV
jgi:hypothetical protein